MKYLVEVSIRSGPYEYNDAGAASADLLKLFRKIILKKLINAHITEIFVTPVEDID